jgi:DNA-directed RNA polymerase specialized sigma subunit
LRVNRAAVGLGSWLLQGAQGGRTVSLDTQDMLLEMESFEQWRGAALEEGAADSREALRALIREAWQEELSDLERHVLRAVLLEGKSENELARALGVHHSAVGRCRRRAEEKLRGGLRYVLRYKALLERMKE